MDTPTIVKIGGILLSGVAAIPIAFAGRKSAAALWRKVALCLAIAGLLLAAGAQMYDSQSEKQRAKEMGETLSRLDRLSGVFDKISGIMWMRLSTNSSPEATEIFNFIEKESKLHESNAESLSKDPRLPKNLTNFLSFF